MPPEKKRGRPRKEEVRRAPYPSGLPRSKKLGGGEEEKPTTKTNVASISEQQQSEDLNTKLKGKDLEKGEDATDPSDKKNSKFDGLFINGLNCIAADHSEFQRLVMKIARKLKLKDDSRDFKRFIINEQRAVELWFFHVKFQYNAFFLEDGTFNSEDMPAHFKKTDVILLALEALEEVPSTWKNAHVIFVTARKAMEDIWNASKWAGEPIVFRDSMGNPDSIPSTVNRTDDVPKTVKLPQGHPDRINRVPFYYRHVDFRRIAFGLD